MLRFPISSNSEGMSVLILSIVGDSLTEHWHERRNATLKQLGISAHGISGETAEEIIRRLPDAFSHNPKYIAILAGTNDIACSAGFFRAESVIGQLTTGIEKIYSFGASPILCTVPPANFFHWRPDVIPLEHIKNLNDEIKKLATLRMVNLIDFNEILNDGHDKIDTLYTNDGTHLTDLAYEKMECLLKRFIKNNVC